MANMRIIGFNDRTAELRRIRIGYEGDNLVERLEFMLPEIAQNQTATLLITGADAVKLDRTDGGRYAVDLTRDMIGPDGEREAYVRIDGAGGKVWQSAPMRLITGALPDVEEEIERVYPTAVGQMLTAMAEHNGEMTAQEERIEQEAQRAEEAADALNDPDVVARTLVPEGEASAEWTVVNGKPTLTLNIPRGKPGDKGDKGDKGDRGYTPVKGVDYTDGVGIDDIAVERLINPNNRDEWKVTFKTTDGKEASYVVADGKDGRTPIKGLDYTDGAPGPGITSLTVTEMTDADGRHYHRIVLQWDETRNEGTAHFVRFFDVYDGTDGAPGKSGVHYGPDEPTDPEVNVWINPEGEGDPVLRYDAQALTKEQQAQARDNIGAAEADVIDRLTTMSRNLFDATTEAKGYYVSYTNGKLVEGSTYNASELIEIEPNRALILSSNVSNSFGYRWALYDSDKKYITGAKDNWTIPATENARFVRFSYANTRWNIQLEYGEKASEYVPFGCMLKPLVTMRDVIVPTYDSNIAPTASGWTGTGEAAFSGNVWTLGGGATISSGIMVQSNVSYCVCVHAKNVTDKQVGARMIFNIAFGGVMMSLFGNSDGLLVGNEKLTTYAAAFTATASGEITVTVGGDDGWMGDIVDVCVYPIVSYPEYSASIDGKTVYISPYNLGIGGGLSKVLDGHSDIGAFGWHNVHFGLGSQTKLDVGSNNTAVGNNAQRDVTAGSFNTAVGKEAQSGLTTGMYNNAFGIASQANITEGCWNSAIGNESQRDLTTGDNNVAIGRRAQNSLQTGCGNVSIGSRASFYPKPLTSGNYHTVIGYEASQTSAEQVDYITAVGAGAGAGANATAIGARSKAQGNGSIAIGCDSTGKGAVATGDNSIVIGTAEHESVMIAGKLIHFNADGTVTWS